MNWLNSNSLQQEDSFFRRSPDVDRYREMVPMPNVNDGFRRAPLENYNLNENYNAIPLSSYNSPQNINSLESVGNLNNLRNYGKRSDGLESYGGYGGYGGLMPIFSNPSRQSARPVITYAPGHSPIKGTKHLAISSDEPSEKWYLEQEAILKKAGLLIPPRRELKARFWDGPNSRISNDYIKNQYYNQKLIEDRREQLNEAKRQQYEKEQEAYLEQQEEYSAAMKEEKLQKAYINFIAQLMASDPLMTIERAREIADEVFNRKRKNN